MPAGLVNGLASRQQFLDLIRYLREIADGGPERAQGSAPDPSQIARFEAPRLRADIDHAGMIADLGQESLKRGEAIYNRVCVNCHGTKDAPGSLPTSLRFASGKFKNGSDPYSLYRTLTHGFGQMPPQTWMVPAQKYDVIHYIRETYLKTDNPTQYAASIGPTSTACRRARRADPASKIEPWSAMDYGPTLDGHVRGGRRRVELRLQGNRGPAGRGPRRRLAGPALDGLRPRHDAAGGRVERHGFIDWNGINFNGQHEIHPRIVGQVELANPIGPGWADPQTGSFDDPRFRGRDGRPYGPLPRSWAHFRASTATATRSSSPTRSATGGARNAGGRDGRARLPSSRGHFAIGPRDRAMVLQVARQPGPKSRLRILAHGRPIHRGRRRRYWTSRSRRRMRFWPASRRPVPGAIWSNTPTATCDSRFRPARIRSVSPSRSFASPNVRDDDTLLARSITDGLATDLAALTRGGPPWPEVLKIADHARPATTGPFAVDTLGLPERQPLALPDAADRLRLPRRRPQAAVCTWDGDVWLVERARRSRRANSRGSGSRRAVPAARLEGPRREYLRLLPRPDRDPPRSQRRRRDRLLRELQQRPPGDRTFPRVRDGPADRRGREFLLRQGRRHGKTALVPQHGTLLRVSRDGLRTEILATGFRAPNGVCVNDDGTFFLTDQEGFWTPKNRINHVKVGGFYGNMWGYHDVTDPSDAAMEPPVCWITNDFDRSPAELLWVTSDAWGPLKGSLLNLSYGNGKIFVVPHETVGGVMQGGMCACRSAPLPTGVMRGRFHPKDGQLYACGMFAWAGNQTAPGGFYRIRSTGKPMFLPIGLHATRTGLQITFTEPIDRASASDPSQLFRENLVAQADRRTTARSITTKSRCASPRRHCPRTAARFLTSLRKSARHGEWKLFARSGVFEAKLF